jgi:hypothetical protein
MLVRRGQFPVPVVWLPARGRPPQAAARRAGLEGGRGTPHRDVPGVTSREPFSATLAQPFGLVEGLRPASSRLGRAGWGRW